MYKQSYVAMLFGLVACIFLLSRLHDLVGAALIALYMATFLITFYLLWRRKETVHLTILFFIGLVSIPLCFAALFYRPSYSCIETNKNTSEMTKACRDVVLSCSQFNRLCGTAGMAMMPGLKRPCEMVEPTCIEFQTICEKREGVERPGAFTGLGKIGSCLWNRTNDYWEALLFSYQIPSSTEMSSFQLDTKRRWIKGTLWLLFVVVYIPLVGFVANSIMKS